MEEHNLKVEHIVSGSTTTVVTAKSTVGIDKKSADYTVLVNYNTTSKEFDYTITVDDDAKFFTVDEDGNITASSYKAVTKDTNDKVYAVIEDYLVKYLVVEEVEDGATTDSTTPAQQNLLASVKVNNKAVAIADGYETVDAAVNNATKVQMADFAIADYTFAVTTKMVNGKGEVVTTGGTNAYGDFGIFGDKAAAETFVAAPTASGLHNNNTIKVTSASAGNYVVMATENHSTVTYYAYYLAK